MSSENQRKQATITLPVQSGDERATEATEPHFMELRKLLRELCRGPYSPEVDEFCIALRIDGEFCYWEKEGCDRLLRRKRERYIIIDLYVPRARWQGASGIEIRRYLATWTEDALKRMIRKLQRDKVSVDELVLLGDFAVVKERYLPQPAPSTSTASV